MPVDTSYLPVQALPLTTYVVSSTHAEHDVLFTDLSEATTAFHGLLAELTRQRKFACLVQLLEINDIEVLEPDMMYYAYNGRRVLEQASPQFAWQVGKLTP